MSSILKGFIMVYRIVGSTMGNQGSTGYSVVSCQLSRLCLDYNATLVVFSCGDVVVSY